MAALRIMYDSTSPGDIPAGAVMVAGYVAPSSFAWSAAGWARFARSIQVKITPSASRFGPGIHVLDIETGDATPAQAPGWVTASRGAGQEGTCYMNMATWPAVIRAINAARIAHPPYWVAKYDGVASLISTQVDGVTYTAIAKQYAGQALTGAHFDKSVVAASWPGVDAEADDMTPDQSDKLDAIFGALYVTNSTPYGVTLFDSAKSDAAQLAAISGALPEIEAAIIAALPTDGATVTDAQMADLETKLSAALPEGWNVAITPKATTS
jgi:hypothetical protein